MRNLGMTLVAFIGFTVCAFSPVCFSEDGLKDGDIQVYSTAEGQGFTFNKAQAKNRFIGDFVRWAISDMGHIPASKDSWLFVGSSSMRMWKTIKKDLAPLKVIHRGFGGSTIWDVMTYKNFFARYKAPNIVVYEGDNDLSTTDLSRADKFVKSCKEFVAYIHQTQPDTKIYFISPKPSISRWSKRATYEKGREGLKEIAAQNDNVEYIDVATEMLGSDGKPKKDIFIRDNLHMNAKGYKIWTNVVRKKLGLKAKADATVVKVSGKPSAEGNILSLSFSEDTSAGGWNSVSHDTKSTRFTGLSGMGDITIKYIRKFNSINKNGTKSPKKELAIPAKLTSTSMWGNSDNPKVVFEISGLDKNKKYNFSFFASRTGVKDNRETTYSLAGATSAQASLDVANNSDKTAEAASVAPTADGKITVTVSKGKNNSNSKGYYYLATMKINEAK